MKHLLKAVAEGVASARHGAQGYRFRPPTGSAVWAPAAAGAVLGVLSANLLRRQRPTYMMAVGGLVGSAIGFGVGMTWTSPGLTGSLARTVAEKVNSVRDTHWLEKNPIAYA